MTSATQGLVETETRGMAGVAQPSTPVVSVIVPVTERPSPLDELYEEYSPVLKEKGIPFEFVFVVEPWALQLVGPLRRLIAAREPVRVFEVGQHVGESAMLESAAEYARGEILVTLPAYPRILPEGVVELIRAVESRVDLATARRKSGERPLVARLQALMFHTLLRLGLGGSFHDVASGVRAMRRHVLETVPVYGDLFRFLPVLAEREGFRVEEVSVTSHPKDRRARIYSPGIYVRRLIDLLGLFFLVRFTRKPLRFFGLVGGVFSGVGAAILLVLFVQRLGGQGIADRPLLLLGVLTFVLGVQAIAIGLVGEIIVHLSPKEGRRAYRIRTDVRD
jgi:hypothetical protein